MLGTCAVATRIHHTGVEEWIGVGSPDLFWVNSRLVHSTITFHFIRPCYVVWPMLWTSKRTQNTVFNSFIWRSVYSPSCHVLNCSPILPDSLPPWTVKPSLYMCICANQPNPTDYFHHFVNEIDSRYHIKFSFFISSILLFSVMPFVILHGSRATKFFGYK